MKEGLPSGACVRVRPEHSLGGHVSAFPRVWKHASPNARVDICASDSHTETAAVLDWLVQGAPWSCTYKSFVPADIRHPGEGFHGRQLSASPRCCEAFPTFSLQSTEGTSFLCQEEVESSIVSQFRSRAAAGVPGMDI